MIFGDKMTNNEVNKIISKYMGYTFRSTYSGELYIEDESTARFKAYTDSLDSLVPVWERLKEDGVWINKMGNRNYNHFGFFSEKQGKDYTPFDSFNFYESLHTATIQEAAAHATARAILELEGK